MLLDMVLQTNNKIVACQKLFYSLWCLFHLQGCHGDLTSEEKQILLAEFLLRHSKSSVSIAHEFAKKAANLHLPRMWHGTFLNFDSKFLWKMTATMHKPRKPKQPWKHLIKIESYIICFSKAKERAQFSSSNWLPWPLYKELWSSAWIFYFQKHSKTSILLANLK